MMDAYLDAVWSSGVYSNTTLALFGFIAWTLLLLLIMEVIRSWLVISGQQASNAFTPDNAGLSPFMQRLARAHANCVEGIPVFGGLMVVAVLTGQAAVTDGTALFFLAARLLQSIIHLSSISSLAVKARFTCFALQLALAVYWCFGLLSGFLTD
jgi:uncharacterized MAPEG superfamily protein